jgi:hypothetical protein
MKKTRTALKMAALAGLVLAAEVVPASACSRCKAHGAAKKSPTANRSSASSTGKKGYYRYRPSTGSSAKSKTRYYVPSTTTKKTRYAPSKSSTAKAKHLCYVKGCYKTRKRWQAYCPAHLAEKQAARKNPPKSKYPKYKDAKAMKSPKVKCATYGCHKNRRDFSKYCLGCSVRRKMKSKSTTCAKSGCYRKQRNYSKYCSKHYQERRTVKSYSSTSSTRYSRSSNRYSRPSSRTTSPLIKRDSIGLGSINWGRVVPK